jgi:hypothetical protein
MAKRSGTLNSNVKVMREILHKKELIMKLITRLIIGLSAVLLLVGMTRLETQVQADQPTLYPTGTWWRAWSPEEKTWWAGYLAATGTPTATPRMVRYDWLPLVTAP